jgi:hypothetical protein
MMLASVQNGHHDLKQSEVNDASQWPETAELWGGHGQT